MSKAIADDPDRDGTECDADLVNAAVRILTKIGYKGMGWIAVLEPDPSPSMVP